MQCLYIQKKNARNENAFAGTNNKKNDLIYCKRDHLHICLIYLNKVISHVYRLMSLSKMAYSDLDLSWCGAHKVKMMKLLRLSFDQSAFRFNSFSYQCVNLDDKFAEKKNWIKTEKRMKCICQNQRRLAINNNEIDINSL